jgi:hypothetical protein
MKINEPKSHPGVTAGKVVVLALTIAPLLLALGCRRENVQDGADNREVRGEPIVSTNGTAAERVETRVLQGTSEAKLSASSPTKTQAEASQEARASSTTSSNQIGPSLEQKMGDHLIVGFDKLASFKYEMPDDLLKTNQVGWVKSDEQIPKEIKALDEKQIALKGYMLPLRVERGLVTELLIMRDQSMCCYGTVPRINEWVSVKMTNVGIKPIMDQPVTLFGRLHVGEMRENGYLVGIYAMDGEKMVGPQDL